MKMPLFQRKPRTDTSAPSGYCIPNSSSEKFVRVPLKLLMGLALMAGAGSMATSCDPIEPIHTEQGLDDSLSVSPVMKELGDMVALLGLTSVSESGGSSNTIKTAKWHDEVAGGTIFATLNEKESTRNKLVYDRKNTADYDGHDYYNREVFEIKDGNITKTFFSQKNATQKPDENTVWTKQYTEILEKKADGIYQKYDYADDFSSIYLPDSYNSLILKELTTGYDYKMSNIEIVRR